MITYVCYLCLTNEIIFVEIPKLKRDPTQIFWSFKILFELNNYYNEISNCYLYLVDELIFMKAPNLM